MPMTGVSGNQQLPYLGIRYQIRYHKCNLDCPYCIVDWKNKKAFFDLNTFQRVVDKIQQLPYRVCLRIGIGGEVFTSPEILGVIRNICNKNSNIFGVSFSTNLYASWEKVVKPFVESTNTAKLNMGCTLHDMVVKDVNLFFEKVARLKEKGVLLYVGYIAIPQRMDFIRKYKQRCDDLGVPLILNALIGTLKGVKGVDHKLVYPRDYTTQERRELKELWYTPHSYKMLVEACLTERMPCSAGKSYIYISSNGNVYPCSLMRKFSMGNILHDDIKFQSKDTICPANVCWCGNENQALRIVDEYYNRTKALRVFYPKENIPKEALYQGYNQPVYLGD